MSEPYLIQRGTIAPDFTPEKRLSDTVNNHYMGASEFEWGALPASLRRMQRAQASLRRFQMESIKDREGNVLVGYGAVEDESAYEAALRDVVMGKVQAKEPTGFKEHTNVGTHDIYRADFWWDIDNHVMLSFNAGYMDALPKILEASWRYMDENLERRK